MGRHAVEWNHFVKWSESSSAVRAGLIIRERREMERERVTKTVQQSEQGRPYGRTWFRTPSVGMRYGGCLHIDWPL